MKKAIIYISLVLLVFEVIVVRSVPVNTSAISDLPQTITLTPTPTIEEAVIPTTLITGVVTSPKADDQVQVIKATYDNENGMIPKKFTVKAGLPVRLEVLAKEDGLGCMGSIMLPELSEDIQGFEEGKTNIFEITPPTPGEYLISCAMGIPHGYITAI